MSDVELPRHLKPDAQGLVRWNETIPARSKLSWRVAYTLEYPTDFVVRSRANAARDGEAPSPSPAKARAVYEQIDALEKAF